MALTDHNEPAAAKLHQPAQSVSATSLKALGRLSEIHHETSQTTDLARFQRSAVGAGALLMLLGGLALVFAGGAGLQQEFAWALLVLAGIGAMLRSYIKSSAQAFDRTPLREAAKDLRAVLFYTGFAWGAGAFLLLGSDPVPFAGLCFAILPTLVLTPVLKDRVASLGFIAPVTLLTAAAILAEPWSDALVALAMLLLVQGSVVAALIFAPRTRTSLPAGLSLR